MKTYDEFRKKDEELKNERDFAKKKMKELKSKQIDNKIEKLKRQKKEIETDRE